MMGYHDAREIPNYWAYAEHYNLQDHMYGATDSWTLPAHLFLVSAWAAHCQNVNDPMSCKSDLEQDGVVPPPARRRASRRSTPGPTSRSSCTSTT